MSMCYREKRAAQRYGMMCDALQRVMIAWLKMTTAPSTTTTILLSALYIQPRLGLYPGYKFYDNCKQNESQNRAADGQYASLDNLTTFMCFPCSLHISITLRISGKRALSRESKLTFLSIPREIQHPNIQHLGSLHHFIFPCFLSDPHPAIMSAFCKDLNPLKRESAKFWKGVLNDLSGLLFPSSAR
jgi:hypothetical protein